MNLMFQFKFKITCGKKNSIHTKFSKYLFFLAYIAFLWENFFSKQNLNKINPSLQLNPLDLPQGTTNPLNITNHFEITNIANMTDICLDANSNKIDLKYLLPILIGFLIYIIPIFKKYFSEIKSKNPALKQLTDNRDLTNNELIDNDKRIENILGKFLMVFFPTVASLLYIASNGTNSQKLLIVDSKDWSDFMRDYFMPLLVISFYLLLLFINVSGALLDHLQPNNKQKIFALESPQEFKQQKQNPFQKLPQLTQKKTQIPEQFDQQSNDQQLKNSSGNSTATNTSN